MTKSELIEKIAAVQSQLSAKDVELAVKMILDHMAEALSVGERIEIRGFGSFSLHYRARESVVIPRPERKSNSPASTSRTSSRAKSFVTASTWVSRQKCGRQRVPGQKSPVSTRPPGADGSRR